MASRNTTRKHKHLQLVTEPGWKEIEGFARTAADSEVDEKERQGALVLSRLDRQLQGRDWIVYCFADDLGPVPSARMATKS